MNRQGQGYYAIIMHSAWRTILNVPGVHVVNVSKRFEFINKPSFIYYLDASLFETHGQIFNDDWLGFACGCKWMNKVPAFALKHFIKYIPLIVYFNQRNRSKGFNNFGNLINDPAPIIMAPSLNVNHLAFIIQDS